jgi:hypothetical protein
MCHRILCCALLVGAVVMAWIICSTSSEVIEKFRGVLFAAYSILLASALFSLVIGITILRRSRESAGIIWGAVIGVLPNILYWANWIFVPLDSILFKIIAWFGLVLGAPGLLIPELWGEQMLLHHPHYSRIESLEQWTLLTVLNIGTWLGIGVLLEAMVAHRRAANSSESD